MKIKKDIVYFDEVAVLKSDVRETMYSVYDLKGNEIIFIRPYVDTQISHFKYTNIRFLNERVNIETTERSYIGLGKKQSLINIIKWLIREKVLLKNGKINIEKLDVFQYKYHEDISNKISLIQKIDCDCDCND